MILNRGLVLKARRELRGVTLLCGIFLLLFQALLAIVFPTIFEDVGGQFLRTRFGQTIFNALLGARVGDHLGAGAMQALSWVHPITLTTVAAHVITCCTRLPAGEVDRGTVDLLFGLPVSRTQAYLTDAVVWAAAGLAVIGLGVAGSLLGSLLVGPEFNPAPVRLLVITCNLFALYLAIGAIACLCSALSDRRGRAVAAAFGILLVAFLINFLAPLWPPAESLSFLSVLSYYQPLPIIRGLGLPLGDILVLLAVAATCFTAGGILLARRDICTV